MLIKGTCIHNSGSKTQGTSYYLHMPSVVSTLPRAANPWPPAPSTQPIFEPQQDMAATERLGAGLCNQYNPPRYFLSSSNTHTHVPAPRTSQRSHTHPLLKPHQTRLSHPRSRLDAPSPSPQPAAVPLVIHHTLDSISMWPVIVAVS